MTCARCGLGPNTRDGEFLSVLSVIVNDTTELVRVLLCSGCRALVQSEVERLTGVTA